MCCLEEPQQLCHKKWNEKGYRITGVVVSFFSKLLPTIYLSINDLLLQQSLESLSAAWLSFV